MAGIEYARARKQDVPEILELLKFANMHHIPSEEMPDLDYRCYFVARDDGRMVGAGGYKILSETRGKTQLMVVHPDWRRRGIGMRLQTLRLQAMARKGVQKVVTNADRPPTIAWYKTHFGCQEVGKLKKVHEFGDPEIDWWTTLELDLKDWHRRREQGKQRR